MRGGRGDPRSTTTAKRSICYIKATKILSVVSFLLPPLTNVFLRFVFSSIRDVFCAVTLFFSLCTESTSYENFPLLGGVFPTLFWVAWIFHFNQFDPDISPPPDWGMLRRSRCVHIFLKTRYYDITSYKNCLQLYGLCPDRFQSIRIIIGRNSSRRTNIFRKINIHALSSRHLIADLTHPLSKNRPSIGIIIGYSVPADSQQRTTIFVHRYATA